MTQVNLIPDIKAEAMKAQRTKRVIQGLALLLAAASAGLAIFAFLFVNVAQKKSISDLQKDIDNNIATLQNDPDLDKVLTVRSQLDSISSLHNEKVYTSNLVSILEKITPADITYSDIQIDFVESTIDISATTDDLKLGVNTYADILKFATVSIGDEEEDSFLAFRGVTAGISAAGSSEKTKDFSISAEFESALFSQKDAEISVQKKITTRSETEKPTDIFAQQESEDQ